MFVRGFVVVWVLCRVVAGVMGRGVWVVGGLGCGWAVPERRCGGEGWGVGGSGRAAEASGAGAGSVSAYSAGWMAVSPPPHAVTINAGVRASRTSRVACLVIARCVGQSKGFPVRGLAE